VPVQRVTLGALPCCGAGARLLGLRTRARRMDRAGAPACARTRLVSCPCPRACPRAEIPRPSGGQAAIWSSPSPGRRFGACDGLARGAGIQSSGDVGNRGDGGGGGLSDALGRGARELCLLIRSGGDALMARVAIRVRLACGRLLRAPPRLASGATHLRRQSDLHDSRNEFGSHRIRCSPHPEHAVAYGASPASPSAIPPISLHTVVIACPACESAQDLSPAPPARCGSPPCHRISP
jgi:hypothetical protein